MQLYSLRLAAPQRLFWRLAAPAGCRGCPAFRGGVPGNYCDAARALAVRGAAGLSTQPASASACDVSDAPGAAWQFVQRRGAKLAKPRDVIRFWKIRVGDQVVVISGKEKGKRGEVLACDKLRNQVKVKGCNMRKLVVDGQVVQIEKKMHYSNVQLIDPLLQAGTRVAIRFSQSNEPLRVSKKSGYVIPWPAEKPEEAKEVPEGEKDTAPEVALARTYQYEADVQSMLRLRQAMQKYNREI